MGSPPAGLGQGLAQRPDPVEGRAARAGADLAFARAEGQSGHLANSRSGRICSRSMPIGPWSLRAAATRSPAVGQGRSSRALCRPGDKLGLHPGIGTDVPNIGRRCRIPAARWRSSARPARLCSRRWGRQCPSVSRRSASVACAAISVLRRSAQVEQARVSTMPALAVTKRCQIRQNVVPLPASNFQGMLSDVRICAVENDDPGPVVGCSVSGTCCLSKAEPIYTVTNHPIPQVAQKLTLPEIEKTIMLAARSAIGASSP